MKTVTLVLPDELKVRWEQFSLDELLVLRSALWGATNVAGISNTYFDDVKDLLNQVMFVISDRELEKTNGN